MSDYKKEIVKIVEKALKKEGFGETPLGAKEALIDKITVSGLGVLNNLKGFINKYNSKIEKKLKNEAIANGTVIVVGNEELSVVSQHHMYIDVGSEIHGINLKFKELSDIFPNSDRGDLFVMYTTNEKEVTLGGFRVAEAIAKSELLSELKEGISVYLIGLIFRNKRGRRIYPMLRKKVESRLEYVCLHEAWGHGDVDHYGYVPMRYESIEVTFAYMPK